ncbi:hypothetical protein RQP46_007370 [Phenoliferia psychrophenolica]
MNSTSSQPMQQNQVHHQQQQQHHPTGPQESSDSKAQGKLTEISGSAEFRDEWNKSLMDTLCLVFIVNVSDHDRLEENYEVLRETIDTPKLLRTPVMVLLNKLDDDSRPSPSGVKERLDAILNARKAGWGEGKVLDISASSGAGILIAFAWMYAKAQVSRKALQGYASTYGAPMVPVDLSPLDAIKSAAEGISMPTMPSGGASSAAGSAWDAVNGVYQSATGAINTDYIKTGYKTARGIV